MSIAGLYFHTGYVSKLEKTVRFMAKPQIDRDAVDKKARLITGFTHNLSGQYKGCTP
ncbi:MAG: hypothetical protein ACNYZG_04365 [Gammaproteobacteria bacterium]